jgi:hypothetical protein
MRLPAGAALKDIDEPAAVRVLRTAIDGGVNYVDTAWDYHEGNAEIVVGKALRDGYRRKVRIATKLPVWLVNDPRDFDGFLNRQLGTLGVDSVDLYLLHALNRSQWNKVRALGVLDWLERAKADGRIGLTGFSFHDDFDLFREVVDAWDRWTFCQIQYNYLDQETQAGTRGLEYAASKGLAVVIMEPLLGGYLCTPATRIQALWDAARVKRSPAEWALQWLWNKPEVSVVLSGMTTSGQVEDNLASAGRSGIGSLDAGEVALVERVAREYPRPPIPCTRCHYCMPCPSDLNIPANLHAYNRGAMAGSMSLGRDEYRQMQPERRASRCTQCGACDRICPQKIHVSEWMTRIESEFGD